MSKLISKHKANGSIYSVQHLRPIIEHLRALQVYRLRHQASVHAKLSISCIIVVQNTADQEVFYTSMLTTLSARPTNHCLSTPLYSSSSLDSDPSDQNAHTSQDSDPFRSACLHYLQSDSRLLIPIAALKILSDFSVIDIHQSSSTPAIQPGYHLRYRTPCRRFIQDYQSDIKACTTHRSPRKLSWQHSSKVIIHTRRHCICWTCIHRLYTQL